jgi:hypothetical protein
MAARRRGEVERSRTSQDILVRFVLIIEGF